MTDFTAESTESWLKDCIILRRTIVNIEDFIKSLFADGSIRVYVCDEPVLREGTTDSRNAQIAHRLLFHLHPHMGIEIIRYLRIHRVSYPIVEEYGFYRAVKLYCGDLSYDPANTLVSLDESEFYESLARTIIIEHIHGEEEFYMTR